MKIVCESCGAKYSIADDRVAGKMFKIRCKKCSEVIVVRGDQQGAAADAGAAAPAAQSGAAIWHVVVDGEQAGPYAPAQLAEMLTNGTVDWEAYVWTEGFDNWSPMRDVADLVAQITGQQPQPKAVAAAGGSGGYGPAHETLTGQPSMGADPFADDGASGDHGLFGGGGGQAAAPEMFARAPAAAPAAFGGGDEPGVVSSSPSPRLSAERAMTGARNENSVLFSLKNLQALATGSGTPSGAPAPAAAAAAGGFAGGEGSGLIDIRALASTTGVGENGSAAGAKDELLSIGSAGGAFGTLGSPMLAPASSDDDGNKKMMLWAIVAGVAMLSIAAVAIVYVLRPQPQAASQGIGLIPSAAAVAPVVPQATPTAAAAAPAAPSEGELAAQKAAAETKEPEKTSSGSSSGSSSHHHRESSGSTGKSGSEPASAIPELTEKKAPPPSKSGPKSIDELLDGALNSSSTPAKAKPSGGSDSASSNLQDTPTRDQAKAAMDAVKPAVQACSKGETGVAIVDVSVAGTTGRVTTAQVKGVTGPAGSCIAQAVRKANFPKFKQAVFKLSYPFKL